MTNKQLAEVAARHGVSVGAVQELWEALRAAGGARAQFNIPELGGMGQWMPGMVMVGSMGDHALKSRVDALCSDLAAVAGTASDEVRPAAESPAPEHWWPESLGTPGSTGGQNSVRYAYFPATNRLLIQADGKVTAYDTSGYAVHGATQQQGDGVGSMTLNTDRGTVPLDRLTEVSVP